MTKIKIRVYGGIGEVGRNCFLLEDKDHRILLDCGIKLVPKSTPEPPKILNDTIRIGSIEGIVLTHGHLDHSGFIPRLYQHGFHGKLVLTKPTLDVMKVLYKDMIKLQQLNKYFLFRAKDAKKTLKDSKVAEYDEWVKLSNGIRVKFLDAGHVLGSAMALIDWEGELILYSGDIKVIETPLQSGIKLVDEEIDMTLIEGTNALRELPPREKVAEEFISDVRKTLESGGKVVIPSLAYGRSQEILYYLLKAKLNHEYLIIVDGMINKINEVYERYLDKKWLNEKLVNFCKDEGIEWLDEADNVISGLRGESESREEFAKGKDPIIILSTSGMLEGGPIHTYLLYTAKDSKNLLTLVNYQVPGTLGREIEEGARRVELAYPDGRRLEIEINMKVKKYELSGHASQTELYKFIQEINTKKILIIHSEPPSTKSLIKYIKKKKPKVKVLNRVDEEAFSLAYDNLFLEY